MRDAKNYKNTVELVAEKLYNDCIKQHADLTGIGGCFCPYKIIEDEIKEPFRFSVICVLNAINFFDDKPCSQCGYFDPERDVCFGEDREHDEKGESEICESFAPISLVDV